MKTKLTTILFIGVFLLGILFTEPVSSQKCNCARGFCCSKYGYCGTDDAYCGRDCRGGPCSQPAPQNNAYVPDFCYTEEINGNSKNYCDNSNTQYPCNPRKRYHGRGPIQLSWNYNYGSAGESLGFDELSNPEIVATDPVVSFKTALWFWMENVHWDFAFGKGFGAKIRAINAMECDGGNRDAMNSCVRYYTDYCRQFGVVSLLERILCARPQSGALSLMKMCPV